MRRTVIAAVATVAVAVLLAMFHTSAATTGALRSGSGSTSTTPTTAAGSSPPTGGSSGAGASGSSTTTAAPGGTRTVTGPVVDTRFGPVQVEITVSGRKITDVKTPQLPSDRERSQEINAVAGPMLISQALQAQSAQIDGVSGATYTSEGFAQSLQAALATAGIGN